MKTLTNVAEYPDSQNALSELKAPLFGDSPADATTAANDEAMVLVHDESNPLWVVTIAMAVFFTAAAAIIALG